MMRECTPDQYDSLLEVNAQIERELTECKAKAMDYEVKRDVAVNTLDLVKAERTAAQKALAAQCSETKVLRQERVTLAAQVLQLREVLKASLITLEKADKDGLIADTIWHTKYETLFDHIGEALALDTKPAEQIINRVKAQALREAAEWFNPPLYAEDVPAALRRKADELDGKCRKCGGNMIQGKAIQQMLTGTPDFPGDDHAVTLSPGGSGKLIDCMKCEKCGWSVTE